jgi:hypothetical protein
MISYDKVRQQLKAIHINPGGWGKGEYKELCNILLPDEVIEAGVNGYYEAGFALLIVTKDRLLIVDKKPLNYLTVEDMRYDMINEFDYQHRFVGAQIKVSAGAKTLHFTSLNQVRLRKCMSYVQARMTQIKQEAHSQQEAQQKHLEQMNKQLEMYLQLQQMQQQQYLDRQQQFEDRNSHGTGYVVQMATAASPGSEPAPDDLTPQKLGIQAIKRVVPVISAYTRLPLMAKQRRFNSSPSSTNYQTLHN